MKLVLFLTNACVILCLIIFDYYTVQRTSEAVSVVNSLSQILDTQGRQRYEVQKHYNDWLLSQSSSASIINSFKNSNLLTKEVIFLPNSKWFNEWPNKNELFNKQAELEKLNSEYQHLMSLNSVTDHKEHIRSLSVNMVGLLDENQLLAAKLSNYLSSRIEINLKKTVYVNAFTLSFLFAFSLIIIYFYQGRNLTIMTLNNQILKQREKELKSSKLTLLSLMEDITFEKNVADSFSDANFAMQVRTDEMEQFIYTVSHDLKSPLVTIGAFSKSLYQELEEQLTEKQRHRLQRIQENVVHMEQLLNDLLALSKVIRQDLQKNLVNTETIINKQISLLESMANEAQATINIHSPLVSIYANESNLSQCVINLLSNAIKYRDSQKTLCIDISTKKEKSQTWLIFKDNGKGIDAKYHQQIFRIFERLEHADGTGVGLTIVKTIMDKHRGTIILNSKVSEGSEFALCFPDPPAKVSK